MTKLREVIAYLCWTPQSKWDQPEFEYYGRILRGINERAESLGAISKVFNINAPDVSPVRLAGVLKSRGVRAIVVAPALDVVHLPNFPWGDFSAVTIGPMLQTPRLHRIQTDQADGMNQCLSRMIARGAHRIGFVAEARVENRSGQVAGAFFALYQRNLLAKQHVPPLIWNEWDDARFRAWIVDHAVDAVITQGVQPYTVLQESSFQHVPLCWVVAQLNHPEIAGPVPRHESIGMRAVDLVLAGLDHSEFGPPPEPIALIIPGLWRGANKESASS